MSAVMNHTMLITMWDKKTALFYFYDNFAKLFSIFFISFSMYVL